MPIETLTEEERAYLRKAMSHPSVLKALRIIDQLTEALAAAQKESDGLHIQCDREHAAWAREKRRAETAERDLAEARAECERLRAVLMIQDEPDSCARCDHVMDGHEAATGDICHDCWNHLEDKLAAANALLVRANAPDREWTARCRAHFASAQPATPSLGADEVFARLRAARQLAAAARGDVLSDGTWLRTPEEESAAPAQPKQSEMTEDEYYAYQPAMTAPLHVGLNPERDRLQAPATPLSEDLGTALVQVIDAERAAAPTRTKPFCQGCMSEPAKPCTEAEQAVLDAMAKVDQEWLRKCEFSREMWLVNFARAELARRGLKP